MTLPNPDGCFVQVWEQPYFAGASDYINGPRRYPSLRDMPGRRDWRQRIRSLKVGSSAAVTAWAQENFSGNTLRVPRNIAQSELPSGLAAGIESMVVECEGIKAQ